MGYVGAGRPRRSRVALATLIAVLGAVVGLAVPAGAVAAPTITSFTPGSGIVTTPVSLTGTNFTGATAVKFNGTVATFTVNSSTSISTTVPAGASGAGKITVTTPGGTGTSTTNFTVAPAISSLSPTSGPVGKVVNINGTGFGSGTTATLNGVVMTVTRWSTILLTAPVPAGASTGVVQVTSAGLVASSATFTVTLGASLSPTVGPPTTATTFSGSGFGANEAVDIYFDSTPLPIVVADAHGDFANAAETVPASASPGTHWFTAVGRHSGSAAQVAFTVRTDWQQVRFGPLHHGTNPYENTLSPSTVAGLGEAWSFSATGTEASDTPAVVGGIAYFGAYDSTVYAVNATTGAKVWSYTTGSSILSSPAVVNGVVYVGSDDHFLYALNAATGVQKWSFETAGAVEGSPDVANGVVYVGSTDGFLYAVSATTGVEQWAFNTGAPIGSSSPAVSNGIAYIGSVSGNLFAVDTTTGAQVWSAATGSNILGSPSVANGMVFVGAEDDDMHAYSAATGSVEWTFTTGSVIVDSPAVVNGVVYFGSNDNILYALEARTGQELWEVAQGTIFDSSPVVVNGVVYFGTQAGLAAVAASNGADLWAWNLDTSIDGDPVVVNGVVYTTDISGRLSAFDLPSGTAAVARPALASLRR